MKIAITFRDDMPLKQLVHANGIAQNIKFLYDLFELIGHQPFFLTFSEVPAHDSVFQGKRYRSSTFREIVDNAVEVPLALEIAVTLNPDHREILRTKCKSKIVSVKYGNSMIMDVQETIFMDKTHGRLYVSEPDSLWISPHFSRSKSYFESLYQCKAHYCPYIWEPEFISPELSDGKVNGNPDIYVMEPNIDVMKSALIPICIISELYKEDSDTFDRAFILNSEHFSSKPFFLNNIVRNLPGISSETQKVFFSGRHSFDEVFRRDDILLGHQWECGLNYLYFEALHKGVRLVHNSDYMSDVGSFYPDCEIQKGVEACKRAIEIDEDCSEQNQQFLAAHSIYNPRIQGLYEQLIQASVAAESV